MTEWFDACADWSELPVKESTRIGYQRDIVANAL